MQLRNWNFQLRGVLYEMTVYLQLIHLIIETKTGKKIWTLLRKSLQTISTQENMSGIHLTTQLIARNESFDLSETPANSNMALCSEDVSEIVEGQRGNKHLQTLI